MRISRDEAREIAITAGLLAIALRIGSGLVQGVEEIGRAWTWRSLAGRVFAPISASIGIMALGVGLLAALSPSGSVSPRVYSFTRLATGVVTVLGVATATDNLKMNLTAAGVTKA